MTHYITFEGDRATAVHTDREQMDTFYRDWEPVTGDAERKPLYIRKRTGTRYIITTDVTDGRAYDMLTPEAVKAVEVVPEVTEHVVIRIDDAAYYTAYERVKADGGTMSVRFRRYEDDDWTVEAIHHGHDIHEGSYVIDAVMEGLRDEYVTEIRVL